MRLCSRETGVGAAWLLLLEVDLLLLEVDWQVKIQIWEMQTQVKVIEELSATESREGLLDKVRLF